MLNAFLIDLDTAGPVDHPLTLEALQATVGGYIEPAFTIDSPTRPGYAVTGYVNDEGAMYETPVSVILDGSPLFGPLIVCGLRDEDGETVPLTAEELDWLTGRTSLLMAAGAVSSTGERRHLRALHALDLDA